MTVVRPDGTLAMGVVQGGKGTLYSTGHRLAYRPKAVAYLGNTASRGAEVDRFFVTDSGGRMHRVTVSQPTGPRPSTSPTRLWQAVGATCGSWSPADRTCTP